MLKRHVHFSLIFLSLFLLFSLWIAPFARAQGVTYAVSQEWVKIWINTDRSIDVQYNLTVTYLSGAPEGIVTVGMPKGGFQIQNVSDLSGSVLQFEDASQDSFYRIDVHLVSLGSNVVLNNPYTFTVYAVVPDMVQADETNSGNVGMLFYPTTFSPVSGSIADLRVAIVLPPGVNSTEVKYPTGVAFDNVFSEGNNTVVYWERPAWSPDQTFKPGVSFPEQYVSPSAGGTPEWVLVSIAVFVVLLVIFVLIAVAKFGKAMYHGPRISVEALGAARGLTAVEAGIVLEQKPVRVLTMILYGLLLKRIVEVTETAPLVKLRKLEGAEDAIQEPGHDTAPSGQKHSSIEEAAADGAQPAGSRPPIRYYEKDFLKAINPDGTLDETALTRTFLGVDAAVNQKLRGHSREDTANYYKSIVDQAWAQVTQAGTPELKGDVLDKNLDWLMADEKFDDRLKGAFPPGVIINPLPGWWWYWGGPWARPGRQVLSSPGTATVPTQAKPLPGQDFANNIVRGLQTTSNGMVKDVQAFTNRLIPLRAAQNGRPVREGSSCVCACHACACACACVSCACACAGGGAR